MIHFLLTIWTVAGLYKYKALIMLSRTRLLKVLVDISFMMRIFNRTWEFRIMYPTKIQDQRNLSEILPLWHLPNSQSYRVTVNVNKYLNEVQVSLVSLFLSLTLMGCESELLNNGNEKSITYYNKVWCVRQRQILPFHFMHFCISQVTFPLQTQT